MSRTCPICQCVSNNADFCSDCLWDFRNCVDNSYQQTLIQYTQKRKERNGEQQEMIDKCTRANTDYNQVKEQKNNLAIQINDLSNNIEKKKKQHKDSNEIFITEQRNKELSETEKKYKEKEQEKQELKCLADSLNDFDAERQRFIKSYNAAQFNDYKFQEAEERAKNKIGTTKYNNIINKYTNMAIKNPFENKEKLYKCPFCLHEHTKEEFSVLTTNILGTNRKIISSVKCPKCQERLPHSFFDDDTKIISIIGDKYVGKTYYAVSLINFLESNSTLHRLGINSELIGDRDTKDRIKQLQALKREGREFDQTSKEASKAAWVLKITHKSKSTYLSFFDNAGEGFAEMEEILQDIEQENKHNLVYADALLFLFAPYQLKCFNSVVDDYCIKYDLEKNRFGRPVPQTENSQSTDSVNTVPLRQVISNVKDLFVDFINDVGKKNKMNAFIGRLSSKKVSIPTAFCLTQYDVIKDRFVYQIPKDSNEEEFEMEYFKGEEFDYNLIDSYSKEIHEMLYNDGKMNDLKNAIEPYFANYKYFTTQSIERKKDDKQTFRDMPRGCALPIIWLFRELNIVKL